MKSINLSPKLLSNRYENVNFIKFTFSSLQYLIAAFIFYINFLYNKLLKKLFKKPFKNYPKRAFQLYNFAKKYQKVSVGISPKIFNQVIKYPLTTALFSLDSINFNWNESIKKVKNSDIEIVQSIHRWYWLIYDQEILRERTTNEILYLVKGWIKTFHYNPKSIIWESYTCSERVTSFCISLMNKMSLESVIELVKSDIEIRNFFENTTHHLINNLEYYPNGVTYNHVLNDLKGLMISAILLEDYDLFSYTFDLFIKETEEVIDQDGFLREGSSHYHLIVTKWYCELEYVILKAEMYLYYSKIHNYTKLMLERVSFFLVGTSSRSNQLSIPMFGDISPDFDPKWMIRYFSSLKFNFKNDNLNYHYADKFLSIIGCDFNKGEKNIELSESFFNYSKLIIGKIILFVKHNEIKKSFIPGHTHDDLFNYVFFLDGVEIIGDPGRLDYTISSFTNPYCKFYSHNVLSINNFSIEVPYCLNYYFPTFYKNAYIEKNFIINSNETILILKTNSLKRLTSTKELTYSRKFILSNNNLTILDEVNGIGKMEIQTFINFTPRVSISLRNNHGNKFLLNDNIELHLNQPKNFFHNDAVFYSKKYGQYEEASQLVFSYSVIDNFKNKIEFKLN